MGRHHHVGMALGQIGDGCGVGSVPGWLGSVVMWLRMWLVVGRHVSWVGLSWLMGLRGTGVLLYRF